MAHLIESNRPLARLLVLARRKLGLVRESEADESPGRARLGIRPRHNRSPRELRARGSVARRVEDGPHEGWTKVIKRQNSLAIATGGDARDAASGEGVGVCDPPVSA